MFNNKKSCKALPVIITALAVITILFSNKINIYAEEVMEENASLSAGLDSKASTMRYSPVIYKIATDGDGYGYYASGNNQILIYSDGDYVCPNGNFLWEKNHSFSNRFTFANSPTFNKYNQLYFNNSGSIYLSLRSFNYNNFSNCYFIADSLAEEDALDLVETNLGSTSIQGQYNIQNLYITEEFGQDKATTEYADYNMQAGTVTFKNGSNVGFYIDYLFAPNGSYNNPGFFRQFFYGLEGQTFTFTALENLISSVDCSTDSDDVLLLGLGTFSYSGSALSNNQCPSLSNCTVTSWSYKSFVYTKYNVKEAFLEEPSTSNSNFKVENSNIINAETDPEAIDKEAEEIREDNFWEAIRDSLDSSLLGQIVSSIKDLALSFSNSFTSIGAIFAVVLGWLPEPIPQIIVGVFMFTMGACLLKLIISLITTLK